jgi:hypothetical protein
MATFHCTSREQGKKFAEDLNFNHQPEIGETFKVLEISKPNGILVAKCQYKNGLIGYLALSQFKCELGMNLFTSIFVVAEKVQQIRVRENHRYPVTKYVVTEL